MTPMQQAIALVDNYVTAHLEKTDPTPDFNVYVVSFTYTLGSWKAMVSTSLPDGMYYEVTYNSTAKEAYIDAYKKFNNVKQNLLPSESVAKYVGGGELWVRGIRNVSWR